MKRTAIIACAAILAASCSANIDKSLPREHSDAVEAAVAAYVEAASAASLPINTIMVLQHGKVLGEAYVNGWTPDSTHHMWSTSKSFTSMAVGLAISEGKLKLDDRLVDFFPETAEKALSTISNTAYITNMQACTVKDLLVMSSGHDTEPAFSQPELLAEKLRDKGVVMNELGPDLCNMQALFDLIGESLSDMFFNTPFVHKPGTHNLYNSPATYMLSAIVQKVTGEKVNDYLEPRLWEPLGIEKPFWQELDGVNCGGWGLFVTPEEMAKVGQMLLQNGKYAGKQVIPADYLKEATTPYFKWGWPEWDPEQRGRGPHNGYGYQFWTFTEGFNTAGARGQFILVLPEFDAVIVCTAEIDNGDFQETELIWKHIVPVLEAETRRKVEIDGALGKLRGDLRIPQEAIRGEKVPAVIICHGVNASRNEPLLNGVAISAQRLGIASVKFDFNGHGYSDGRFVDMTIVNEKEDLEKIYEYVKSLDFVDPSAIAVLGHSQGGAIAGMFAADHPELGGLIMCASGSLALQLAPSMAGMIFPDLDMRNLPDSFPAFGNRYLGKEYLQALDEVDAAGLLAKYKGPCCIVNGTEDELVPVCHSRIYKAIMPQAELHVLEGLHHGFEPDQQQAIDVCADFLKRTFCD